MNTPYTIYNASAGSGKTYGLVKAYLKIILSTTNADYFRHLLAITFTNKAVFEMKNRIIEALIDFSDEKSLTKQPPMFSELHQELKIAPLELQNRANNALKHILHNYASFNISTIDGFNHQLIRNFAFDLHLNQFFEVQLDAKKLLERAVDNLLNLAGNDTELTLLLTDFSNEKIKEDKNWDTTSELLEVAEMLTNENHYSELNILKTKSLEDFKNLKNILFEKKNQSLKSIKQNAESFFNLLNINELDETAFSGKYVFNFFKKVLENPEKEPEWTAKWQENLGNFEIPLYSKTNAKKLNTSLIDSLQPEFFQLFEGIKTAFGKFNFYKNALRYIVPLALLNRIQNEIELIKSEENILPIWEFNGVISNEIISQPALFIYERIGERYRHYFIDEFQDTSVLQWNNFIPLILNAIQSESMSKQSGSLLLVGDAKQSIYRWRGGKAEQFMNLYLGKINPFFVKGEVIDLEENYRSLPTIINFNNAFFSFVAEIFQSEEYKNLYKNAVQNYPQSKEEKNLPQGFLEIQYIDIEEDTHFEEDEMDEIEYGFSERNRVYCQAVLETIERVNQAGVKDREITILVRKNSEGAAIASFLSSKGKNIISPEALLLENVASVRFLVSLLNLLYKADNQESKLNLLFDFITMKDIKEVHSFLMKYKDNPMEVFFADFSFSMEQFNNYSLYEGVVYAVNCFEINRTSDAYLTHFLDLIFDFKNARKGGLADFLNFWEEEKGKLSISSPEGLNAISIMTVHKSKGLSAPVIIYAFADTPLVEKRKETIWYPVNENEFGGFSSLLLHNNKSLANYEEKAQEIVLQQHEQYVLDNINVLYVAMTRPESFLFVISSLPKKENITYGTIFRDFLEEKGFWSENKYRYSFGEMVFPAKKEQKEDKNDFIQFQKGWATPRYKIATGASLLWDTKQENSIEKGNLTHDLLSKITYSYELDTILNTATSEGIISDEQEKIMRSQLEKLLKNDQISEFFTEKYDYFIEREFLTAEGKYFRPDRIALDKATKTAVIIDYKTGKTDQKHAYQLQNYARILSELGWNVTKKYLLYLDENQVVSV